MLRKVLILIFILAMCTAGALAASPGKVESAGPLTDSAASPAIKAAVEPDGHRLTIYDGSIVNVWFSKSIPAAKEKDPNAVYPQIGRSTFVGVINFQRAAKDFRGQGIRPGTYAMRFELLPSDGNHMGVAAQPDFVLLTPLASDTDPNATYDFAKLIELSAQASGTGHPASFSMVPTDDVTSYPSLFYTSDGYVAFAAKVKAASGELPIAIVVKGVAQQ
ncbi:MAG TPA: hypothetical protein VFM10_12410 [Terriglobales bacterium]|jgi:hypothetical protein|nr:hypothetical protein [Terriglobales bacterium]